MRAPDMEIGIGLEGYFEVELIDAETGIVKRHLEFHNVITDAGMDNIGFANGASLDALTSDLAVGTDSTAPSQSDTSLGTRVAVTARSSWSQSSGPNFDYWEATNTYEFGKTEANDNLTELATLDDSEANFFTRQLFRDANGDPTTITKTSDDILKVRYLLRVYPDKTVKTKTIDLDIKGALVTTTVTYQPQEIGDDTVWGGRGSFTGMIDGLGNWSPSIGRWYQDNTPPGDFQSYGPASTGTSDFGGSASMASTYTAGTYYRDITLFAGDSVANFASGVGSIAWGNSGDQFLTLFDPRIDKTNQDELTLTVRISWSRVAV